MNTEIRDMIKKHAGILWLAAVGVTFIFFYVVCNILTTFCGVAPDLGKLISGDIGIAAAITMYLVLGIYGLRNL